MSFDYLLTSLAKGDFDIVMAAIEVTPERLQSADFSDPYYTDLPAMILVKADAADHQDSNKFITAVTSCKKFIRNCLSELYRK